MLPSFFKDRLLPFGGLGLLGGLLAVAVWHDVRHFRVPNLIVFSGVAIAVLLHGFVPSGIHLMGSLEPIGILQALGGLAIGLGAMLPLYVIGAAGAGDAKLMAMVGAFLGPRDIIGALIGTYVFGALLGLAIAWKTGAMRRTAHNIRLIVFSLFARLASAEGPSFDARTQTAVKLPYAVAIALGTGSWVALRHFV